MEPKGIPDDQHQDDDLQRAEAAEQGQLGGEVGEDAQIDHPLPLIDGPLCHDLSRCVAAAEPDGGDHQQEEDLGGAENDVEEVGRRTSTQKEGDGEADDGRLGEQDAGVGSVLPLEQEAAAEEDGELTEQVLLREPGWAVAARLLGLGGALGNELAVEGGGAVAGDAACERFALVCLPIANQLPFARERSEDIARVIQQRLGGRAAFAVHEGDGLGIGGAVVDERALAHEHQVIHEAIGLERGLVERQDDGAAAVGQLPQQAHDVEGVFARESGGGLVEEEQPRRGEELLREVDPLALPAGDALGLFVADDGVGHMLDLERGEHLADAPVDLLVGEVGGEAEFGRRKERLVDGEVGVDDVFLRDVTDALAEGVEVVVEVESVDEDRALAGALVAVDGLQQRRLACA